MRTKGCLTFQAVRYNDGFYAYCLSLFESRYLYLSSDNQRRMQIFVQSRKYKQLLQRNMDQKGSLLEAKHVR